MNTIWAIGGEDVRMRIPILKKLSERGFSVAAVGSEEPQPFERAGITYHRYDLNRGFSPISDWRSMQQLVELFKLHQPDVVHAFDTKPAMIVPYAARKANIKGVVRTVTGMGWVFSSNSPLALLLRPVYRKIQYGASNLSDFTIFQNLDDKQYFEKHQLIDTKKSVLVRGSGVDPDDLLLNTPTTESLNELRRNLNLEGKFTIVMVSRLVKNKGVVNYLEASRIVKRSLPNCHFLLVGPQSSEGSQAVPLKIIRQYSDSVDWLGLRNDVSAILSLCDIFVLPTYYREGVPRVLLEAGLKEVPLITTDMPGCRDVVIDGYDGLLIPPKDSLALAKAIIKLASDQDMRISMGANAKSYVEKNFLLSSVLQSYLDIYSRLLNK